MIVRGRQKLAELLVGHRVPVDVERCHIHRLVMIPARRIFPWILQVHADLILAFDLDARHPEAEASHRECESSRPESRTAWLTVGAVATNCCVNASVGGRKPARWRLGQFPISPRNPSKPGALRCRRQHRPVTRAASIGKLSTALPSCAHRASTPRHSTGRKYRVPVLIRTTRICAPRKSIFVAIDEGPQRHGPCWKLAREDERADHRRMRLPFRADQSGGEFPFDFSQCAAVPPRRDPVIWFQIPQMFSQLS